MRLILVRHAATANNESGLLQEDHTPLNEKGRKQAKLVGERLSREKIDFVYSSPHTRTKQTAAEIAKHHGLEVIDSYNMRERDFGIFTGKPGAEFTKWREENKLGWEDNKPANGESYREVYVRSQKFVDEARNEHPKKTVVIVSHGGVITTTVLRLLGLPHSKDAFDAHQHHNTAVSIARFNENIEFEIVACTHHLPEELMTKLH